MAGRIYDRLVAKYGQESTFMDIDTIPSGVDFRDFIQDELTKADVMLVVIGDSWLKPASGSDRPLNRPTDYVRLEIEAALRRKIPIIPVLVGSAAVPKVKQLPPSLKDLAFRSAVKVDPGLDFHHHMNRLIDGLDQHLPHRQNVTPTDNDVSPTVDYEIFDRVLEILVDSLGVDDEEVTPDALLLLDLGVEEMDYSNIVSRLEKAFMLRIPREDIFPDSPDRLQSMTVSSICEYIRRRKSR
jgi:acyl carrier protein